MSVSGEVSVVGGFNETEQTISPGLPIAYPYLMVLFVFINAAQTVSDITFVDLLGGPLDGTSTDFTERASYTTSVTSPSGLNLVVFERVADPDTEAWCQYKVHYSPAIPFDDPLTSFPIMVWLVKFSWSDPSGPLIQDIDFAETSGATSLTLPSVDGTEAADLFTLVRVTAGTDLTPQSPLVAGSQVSGSYPTRSAHEGLAGLTGASGTRSYTFSPSSAAVGTILTVGNYVPVSVGGWGVGFVRMGN